MERLAEHDFILKFLSYALSITYCFKKHYIYAFNLCCLIIINTRFYEDKSFFLKFSTRIRS